MREAAAKCDALPNRGGALSLLGPDCGDPPPPPGPSASPHALLVFQPRGPTASPAPAPASWPPSPASPSDVAACRGYRPHPTLSAQRAASSNLWRLSNTEASRRYVSRWFGGGEEQETEVAEGRGEKEGKTRQRLPRAVRGQYGAPSALRRQVRKVTDGVPHPRTDILRDRPPPSFDDYSSLPRSSKSWSSTLVRSSGVVVWYMAMYAVSIHLQILPRGVME